MRFSVLVLLLLAGCSGVHHAPWSGRDLGFQGVVVGLQVADWGQTRDQAGRYGEGRWETNPVLGEFPSKGEVDVYMVLGLVGKVLVTDWLAPEYRTWWQAFWIGVSGACVVNNAGKGLRVRF